MRAAPAGDFTKSSAAVHEEATLSRERSGGSLVRAGKAREGLTELLAALQLRPTDVMFRYNAALAYEQLGRAGDAVEQLEAALRADPRHAPSLRALGRIRQAEGLE